MYAIRSYYVQQGDFEALYKALGGYPVTIRFLDPPLHEFLPTDEDDIRITSYNVCYTKLLRYSLICSVFFPLTVFRSSEILLANISLDGKSISSAGEIVISSSESPRLS